MSFDSFVSVYILINLFQSKFRVNLPCVVLRFSGFQPSWTYSSASEISLCLFLIVNVFFIVKSNESVSKIRTIERMNMLILYAALTGSHKY